MQLLVVALVLWVALDLGTLDDLDALFGRLLWSTVAVLVLSALRLHNLFLDVDLAQSESCLRCLVELLRQRIRLVSVIQQQVIGALVLNQNILVPVLR